MMSTLNFILLMGAPAGQEQNPYSSFIFLALIIVVFYMFMIRPQMKRQKELRKFRESLAKGDKIITTGGIYGKIHGITEKAIIIEVEDGGKLKVDKSAIIKDSSDLEQKR